MWLPGQSIERLGGERRPADRAGPDHVSLYLLELYPNAPLKEEMARAAGRRRRTRTQPRCT